jgi:SEC-C motif-containing protein
VRDVVVVARGKGKRKGFAELLGERGVSKKAGNANDDDVDDAVGANATSGMATASTVKATVARTVDERCPCGGGSEGRTYGTCCKPYHDGEAYPSEPVTLMRSRFSAYAKGKGLYVVKTTHPDNPLLKEGSKTKEGKVVSSLARDVEYTCKKVRFYDLEIVRDKPGKKPEEEHFVGFRYKCRVVGQQGFNELAEEKHAELSTFRKDDGVWKFVDGIQGQA